MRVVARDMHPLTHASDALRHLGDMLRHLPIRDRPDDEAKRVRLFEGSDLSNNGSLTLLEVNLASGRQWAVPHHKLDRGGREHLARPFLAPLT